MKRRRNPAQDNVTEEFEKGERGAYLDWFWIEGTTRYKASLFVQTKAFKTIERGEALLWLSFHGRKPGRDPSHPRSQLELWREVFPMKDLWVNLNTGAIRLSDKDLRELGIAGFFRVQQMAARIVELLK